MERAFGFPFYSSGTPESITMSREARNTATLQRMINDRTTTPKKADSLAILSTFSHSPFRRLDLSSWR